jgi:ABC-type sugar transport system permease subunit
LPGFLAPFGLFYLAFILGPLGYQLISSFFSTSLVRPGLGSGLGVANYAEVPPQVLIVPWFQEFSALGLLNTYWAVILPAVPQAVAVFVFKQFFDGRPKELEESARLDGASYWTIYRRIIMPLSRPAASAVASSRSW